MSSYAISHSVFPTTASFQKRSVFRGKNAPRTFYFVPMKFLKVIVLEFDEHLIMKFL